MKMLIRAATLRADKVLVDYCSVKNELMERLKVPEYKIRVAPLGVSPIYRIVNSGNLMGVAILCHKSSCSISCCPYFWQGKALQLQLLIGF